MRGTIRCSLTRPAFYLVCLGFVFPHLCNVHASDKATRSVEYELAVINARGYVPEDDITVRRFRVIVRQLDATFPEDAQRIGDLSVWAINKLKENQIDQNLLQLMESMNQIFSHPVQNQKYTEYLAAYLTIRLQGESHADCIVALKAIVAALIE